MEEINFIPIIGTDHETGRKTLLMENNDTITFDIEEEGDYTLSFEGSYLVNATGYITYFLNMIKDGVETYIDEFSKGTSEFAFISDVRKIILSGHFLANSKLQLKYKSSSWNKSDTIISDLQLEKGLLYNTRNMLGNSNFSLGLKGWNINNENYQIVNLPTQETALKINSNPDIITEITRNIQISEKKGQTYELSFWYKNEGIIVDETGASGNIVKILINDENIINKEFIQLNTRNTEWQYFSYTFKTKVDDAKVTLKIISKDINSLYVTNFMLITDARSLLYDYDEEGNLVLNTDLNRETTNLKYDENNQLISMFKPLGNNFKYEYDNKVTDRILKGISPSGISNEIKYDSNGNPVRTLINNVNPDGRLKNNGNYHIRLKGTEKYISGNYRSNMITIEEDNCNYQHFKIIKEDDYYRIKAGYKYLAVVENQVILYSREDDYSLFKITINNNGSYTISPKKDLSKVIENKEDKLFILEKQENDGNNQFYFEDIDTPLFIESKSYYTPDGKFVTCVEDSLSKKTHYDINTNTGLVSSITNSKGIKTENTYNNKDQITSVTNNNKTINYEYDEQNLLSKIKSGSKEYKFTYDEFGKSKTSSINNNILINHEYEENNGNLLRSTYGNGSYIEYTYDDFDRLSSINLDGKVYYYHYDDFGEVIRITTDGLYGNVAKQEYFYDLARRLESIYLGNFYTKYKYDENNNVIYRLHARDDEDNVRTKKELNYYYTDDDSILSIEINDTHKIHYTYDYLGRLTTKYIGNMFRGRTNNMPNCFLEEYTYITNGDKTSLVVDTMKVDNDLYKYIYDDLYNITHIYLNNEIINEYEYDDINELISEKDYLLNRSYKYIYDKEGNILKKQEYELNTHKLLKEDKYEYNNPSWEDQLTKFNDTTITYDEIGNPLTIGNANLTWKNGRQLNSYTDNDLNVTYSYDINGIRTTKIVNDQVYRYNLEGNKIIFEERPEGVIYYIRDEEGELIGLEFNDQVYLYKKNLQGDIIGIFDNNYDLIVNYNYDSWGNIISITDNNGNNITDPNNIGIINPFRYNDYYYDAETSMYYLNGRYYNSLWGRFVNADNYIYPNIGNILGNNLYTYCNNNPVNNVDNIGNSWKKKLKKKAKKYTKKIINTIEYIGNKITNAVSTIGNSIKNIFGVENTVNIYSKEEKNIPFIMVEGTQGITISETTGSSGSVITFTTETSTKGDLLNLGIKIKDIVELKIGPDNIGLYFNSITINNTHISSGNRINLKEVKLGTDVNIITSGENISSTNNVNVSFTKWGLIGLFAPIYSPKGISFGPIFEYCFN